MAVKLASVATLLLVLACEHADSSVARGQMPAAAADSGAGVWLARAKEHPEIASWLYLRAAAATHDSAARRALYARVHLPVARDRIPWVEAETRERMGDTTGALAAYRALRAPVAVFRLRVTAGNVARDSVRTELLRFITTASGNAVSQAVGLFDGVFTDPTASEQLSIARAAARAGRWSRASTGFDAAADSAMDNDDRFAFATALARTGSSRRAASVYATVRSPASLALAAQYQRARALLAAGDGDAARTALARLARSSDTSGAAALNLLADLQTDDGDDAASRRTLLSLVRRFPDARLAGSARFNAAIVAFILGDMRVAERELATLARSQGGYAEGAEYWLGRARDSLGDTTGARTAWRSVLRRDSTAYYAALAAARLGVASMHSSAAAAGFPHVAAVDSALLRVSMLKQLGMSREARFENDDLYARAITDTTRDGTRLLATAAAFSATDQAARGIALGRRALAHSGSTPGIWRLIYPVAARDTIVAESRRVDLDPALVAGLIRQESLFNPGAVSAAGARGLMQVMPSVGASVASSIGITAWNPALLYDPGINIEIGVRHLAPLLARQPNVQRALAAYNAGESRVTRWATKRGSDDPEIFTERIPFQETRDYVKSVLRNREFYRVLYAW